MRNMRFCEALSRNGIRDSLDELFPLDTDGGFL
jgi:hypothetical protein